MTSPPTLLGIESSCDDTAVALVEMEGSRGRVRDEIVVGQRGDHAAYGGVVPEIAARRHAERVDVAIREMLERSGFALADLSAIAATAGPGLAGGLVVGLSAAKALALALDKPLLAVNHLEGHALSPGLSAPLACPYLLLLVSGGHCAMVEVKAPGHYAILGATRDDAAGEAFDKVARLLGLDFPGGPAIERCAEGGDPLAVSLPHPLRGRIDMSFSGLKTAVSRLVAEEGIDMARRADICASFQETVCDILGERARLAMARDIGAGRLVVAGGVAANGRLRERLRREAARAGFAFHAPPMRWCTDNAAMIAYAGGLHFQAGRISPLDTPIRVRWPLDEARASLAAAA